MPHRPYPDRDRALRQLDRRQLPQPATPSPFTLKLIDDMLAVRDAVGAAIRPMVEAIADMRDNPKSSFHVGRSS